MNFLPLCNRKQSYWQLNLKHWEAFLKINNKLFCGVLKKKFLLINGRLLWVPLSIRWFSGVYWAKFIEWFINCAPGSYADSGHLEMNSAHFRLPKFATWIYSLCLVQKTVLSSWFIWPQNLLYTLRYDSCRMSQYELQICGNQWQHRWMPHGLFNHHESLYHCRPQVLWQAKHLKKIYRSRRRKIVIDSKFIAKWLDHSKNRADKTCTWTWSKKDHTLIRSWSSSTEAHLSHLIQKSIRGSTLSS